MQIAIDLRGAHSQKTGIGVYASCLSKHLLEVDGANQYYNIILQDQIDSFPCDKANLNLWITRVSGEQRLLREPWEFIYLPWKLWNNKIDVYHGPGYSIPFLANCATVVTIHDLNTFLFSHTNSWLSDLRSKPLILLSAKKATLIITDSGSTKSDIVSILKVPEEKVRVVHLAPDKRFITYKKQDKLEQETKKKYGIRGRFILFVGSLNPRKNLSSLVKAFHIFSQRHTYDYQLVVVGKKEWCYDEIFRAVRTLMIEDKVVFTGYVNDSELPALYSAASLTVYPSVYEGFGFPILESMACGTPVVASNISSIPEVAGDAAILVDPTNVNELASAIHSVLTDVNLRQTLTCKGLERARSFSWQETACNTLKVYQEAYEIWNRQRKATILTAR